MLWIWANERSDEYELRIDGVPPMIEQHDWNFDLGVYVTDSIPVIDIPYQIEPDERMTDNLIAPGCRGLLVHKKIRSIFDKAGVDNIQYFNTRLINTVSGDIREDYLIANIVGKIDGINYDKSELVYDDKGRIQYIDSLNLKQQVDNVGDIFRLSAFLPVVVVSDALKRVMDDADISGIKFYLPEDFSL